MSTIARYLLLAQVGFFLALAVCAVIEPEGLNDNHGWSYYEGRGETVGPYLLGILGGIALIVYASYVAERSAVPAGLARGLRWLALFLFLDIATPDTLNVVFYWAHDLTSTLLFLYQLGFGIWLVRTVWPTRLGVALLGAQFVGGLVAMSSQLQLIPLLGLGILVFQLSFGVLLVAATAPLGSVARDAPDTGDEVPAPAAN